VAERDHEIVGMASAGGGELRNLYVAPTAWGSGAASELMRAALDWLAESGVHEAVLWVGEGNARARRFYEREGWTADGETRESPLGPPEVRYRRAL
jgi:GNAT superfamily N-acetyltransferase